MKAGNLSGSGSIQRPKEGRTLHSALLEHSLRPPPFSAYTAEELWTDPHLAEQMLAFHLDPDQDLASRNHAFIRRSVDWLIERFDLAGGKRVLDLGCGPGLYANALAESGASVTGIDFSENSLAYARSEAESRGLEVAYQHGNYLDTELDGTFDLILLIFGDFCPLGPSQKRSLLDGVRGWLSQGGRFVFDVSSVTLFENLEESSSYEEAPDGGFWSPDSHFVFMKRFKYAADLAYLDRYLVVEAARHREFFNWIQCYSPTRLKSELRDAGWKIEETLGNVAGDPLDPKAEFFAVIARPNDSGFADGSERIGS